MIRHLIEFFANPLNKWEAIQKERNEICSIPGRHWDINSSLELNAELNVSFFILFGSCLLTPKKNFLPTSNCNEKDSGYDILFTLQICMSIYTSVKIYKTTNGYNESKFYSLAMPFRRETVTFDKSRLFYLNWAAGQIKCFQRDKCWPTINLAHFTLHCLF